MALPVEREKIIMVTPERLVDGPHLRGDSVGRRPELGTSIGLRGQISPVVVWQAQGESDYHVIDGHGRVQEIKHQISEGKLPSNTKIRCLLQLDVSNEREAEDRALMIFTTRKRPDRASLAKLIHRRIKIDKHDPKQVAAECGFKQVSSMMRYVLLVEEASDSLMTALAMGIVGFEDALRLSKLPADDQLDALQQLIQEADPKKAKKLLRRLAVGLNKANAPGRRAIKKVRSQLDTKLNDELMDEPENEAYKAHMVGARAAIKWVLGELDDEEALFDPEHRLIAVRGD